jgi:hypothetical protein
VKIFLGHGTADPLLPLPLAAGTRALLQAKGFRNVDFRTYSGMQHSTCPEELADLRRFLADVLPDRVPSRLPGWAADSSLLHACIRAMLHIMASYIS